MTTDTDLRPVVREHSLQDRGVYPPALERHAAAFDALLNGATLKQAAIVGDCAPSTLLGLLERHPDALARIKGRRELLRELALLKTNQGALQMADDHLDGTKPLSPRDLTDLMRATNHSDKAGGTRVNIVIPQRWLAESDA